MYENPGRHSLIRLAVLRLGGNDPLSLPLSSLPSPTQASWDCFCRPDSRATSAAFAIILHQNSLLDPYPFHIPKKLFTELGQLIDIPCSALFSLCSTPGWGSPSGGKDAKELVQLLPPAEFHSSIRLSPTSPSSIKNDSAQPSLSPIEVHC